MSEVICDGWWVECKFTNLAAIEEHGPDWGPYMGAKDKRDAVGWAKYELKTAGNLEDDSMAETRFAIAKYKDGKRDEASFLEITLGK